MFSMARDEDAGHVIGDTARQVINAVLGKEKAASPPSRAKTSPTSAPYGSSP